MPSVSARVAPVLVLASTSSPLLLWARGGSISSWIPACVPGLILASVSAGSPALLGTSVPARHPGLIRSGMGPVPAWNPRLVLTGVPRSVSARVPDLLLRSVSTRGPDVRASVPAGVPALVLRLRLPPAGLWALRPHILRHQSWRQPCSGRSHGPWVRPIGQAA